MTIQEIIKLRQETKGMSQLLKMKVISLDEFGGATVSVDITPDLLNPLGIAHGGAIYTLCDIAAGSAAASRGRVAVTLSGSIQYYRPGRLGEKLIAVSYERKSGKKTATYMVEVHDEKHYHIADAIFTMFYTDQSLEALR